MALLLGVTSLAFWWMQDFRVSISRVTGAAEASRQPGETASPVEASAARLVSRSAGSGNARAAAAERWLASQPRDPAVVSVGTHVAVTGLEDRIAQLDDLLTAARAQGSTPTSLSALEEQRARLVRSLAQVRFAEDLVAQSPH